MFLVIGCKMMIAMLTLLVLGIILARVIHTSMRSRYMHWREYELYCAEKLKKKGYKRVKVGKGRNDGGVDITCRKGPNTYLVQCKRYKGRVGVKDIRELYGVCVARQEKGIFMTTKGYTKAAREFAKGRVKLMIA